MGGDVQQLRYEIGSEDCERFKIMLNDCAKYATVLKAHMRSTGKSLEDL